MRDMTKGGIVRHLLSYTVPMILGNLMQLTYNAADSVIIGKTLGEDALAAVSTANPIMTIMILGASGIGIGAGVIMSRFYGAGDGEKLKREFSTTVLLSTLLSLIVFALGFAFSPAILRLIHTPENSLTMAVTYLRIIFAGFLFNFQYNILSHAMRAIGDSASPVRYLGISCAVNIVLDFLLVTVLRMGVAGAALATAFSQFLSMLLCVLCIRRRIPCLRVGKGGWKMDRALLSETVSSGALTALQQAAQPVGKVLIQSVINAQGTAAIGAFNAVCRVDDFACIPSQSMGSGIMTCTAQNRGAGDRARVKESFKKGLLLALCWYPIICGFSLLLRRPLMRLLTPEGSTEMIEMGIAYLLVKSWIFVMPCINNAIQGFFRGLGRMSIVLTATCIQISVRAFCVWLWVPNIGIPGEAWACLTGWLLQLLFESTVMLILHKKNKLLPG